MFVSATQWGRLHPHCPVPPLFLFLLLAVLAAGAAASADQTTYNAVGQAATWLDLPDSARVAAMGGASAALDGDVNTITVNPAGLSGLGEQQLSLMDNSYVQDMSFDHLAYGVGLDKTDGLAASLDYMNYGSVPTNALSDGVLVQTGSLSPYGLAAGLGYGRAFGDFSAGATVKLVTETLDGGAAGTTGGGDLGVLWGGRDGHGFSAGFAVDNLGGRLDGAPLPTQYHGGLAYQIPLFNGRQELTFAGDAAVPEAEADAETLSIGGEYSGDSLWVVRAGYKSISNGGLGGLSVGAGLRYGVLGLDYAFMEEGILGAANLVTLTLHLPGPAPAPAPRVPQSAVHLILEQGAFSPSLGVGAGQVQAVVRDGVQCKAWGFYIYEGRSVVRVISGQGMPPGSIVWDGKLGNGAIARAGYYPALLAVRLADGTVRYSDSYAVFAVYDAFPKLVLQWDPRSVDPERPADVRFVPAMFRVLAGRIDPNLAWRLQIIGPDGTAFRTFDGALGDPSVHVWDGNGDNGHEYYSNYVYEFRLTLMDKLGDPLWVSDDQKMTMVFAR